MCNDMAGDMVWFLSDLWDRAAKDLYRRHSLFKGVFPIHAENLSETTDSAYVGLSEGHVIVEM